MGQSSLADLPPHSAVRLCLTVEPLPDYWRLRLRFIRRSLMNERNKYPAFGKAKPFRTVRRQSRVEFSGIDCYAPGSKR